MFLPDEASRALQSPPPAVTCFICSSVVGPVGVVRRLGPRKGLAAIPSRSLAPSMTLSSSFPPHSSSRTRVQNASAALAWCSPSEVFCPSHEGRSCSVGGPGLWSLRDEGGSILAPSNSEQGGRGSVDDAVNVLGFVAGLVGGFALARLRALSVGDVAEILGDPCVAWRLGGGGVGVCW